MADTTTPSTCSETSRLDKLEASLSRVKKWLYISLVIIVALIAYGLGQSSMKGNANAGPEAEARSQRMDPGARQDRPRTPVMTGMTGMTDAMRDARRDTARETARDTGRVDGGDGRTNGPQNDNSPRGPAPVPTDTK